MAAMVLSILGSKGMHNISGGKLMMVESVMRGTYYGWDKMYILVVQCMLNQDNLAGGDFYFPSFLCSFFF